MESGNENGKDLNQKEEENFNAFEMINNDNTINEDLNFDKIREVEKIDRKNIEDLKNNKTKSLTRKISDRPTTTKTMPSRREIIDEVTRKTSLLDLELSGKNLKELIKEEEEKLTKEYNAKPELIIENKDVKKNNEINNKNENNMNELEAKDNEEKKSNFSDDDSISEEKEEIKIQRKLIIEKMQKRTDDIVDMPNFTIFDETKMVFLKEENDLSENK